MSPLDAFNIASLIDALPVQWRQSLRTCRSTINEPFILKNYIVQPPPFHITRCPLVLLSRLSLRNKIRMCASFEKTLSAVLNDRAIVNSIDSDIHM